MIPFQKHFLVSHFKKKERLENCLRIITKTKSNRKRETKRQWCLCWLAGTGVAIGLVRIKITKITDAQFYACSNPSCCTWVLIKLFAIQRPPHICCTARWPAMMWCARHCLFRYCYDLSILIQEVTQKMQNKISSPSFLFFVSISNLVFNFYFISFCFQQKAAPGQQISIIESLSYWKSITFACFFCGDEEEDVAGGYMCVHCNILYGCPLTYEVFLRCHY